MSDLESLEVKDEARALPFLVVPVLALIVQIVAIAVMPWAECIDESPTVLDSDIGRYALIAVTILASLGVGIAALIRLAAWRREHDLAGPRRPALWGIVTVGLGAAGLIGIPELSGGVGLLAIFGIPAAVIGLFGVLRASFRGGYAREASVYLPIYLAALAFAVYPSLTVFALHLSSRPFLCGFN